MATVRTSPDVVEVVCAGDPRELGLAQGVAAKAKILASRTALAELEAFRKLQPAWMPYRLFRWASERKATRFLNGPLSRDFPHMRQRLDGLAEGSGLGNPAIDLLNALEPMLSSVGGCTACPGACSAAAVRGRRSKSGAAALAQNFDYLPLVQPFYIVRECRPKGKLRSLEFTIAPLVGTVDGVNEGGLCITYNYGFTIDGLQKPAAPISMAISEALANCTTTTEAAAWIAAKPRSGGGLLMLADAGGDIASLEVSATRSWLRRPSAGDDAIFHTNAFVGPEMLEVQIPKDAVYTDAAPTPLRGRRLHLSSERRDDRFRELLETPTVFGPDELTALFSDHGHDGVAGDLTICMHGSYWHTTCCVQLFPQTRSMRIAYDTTCRAEFREACL
jgi:hypothetical protein